jgi:hypothetical protein
MTLENTTQARRRVLSPFPKGERQGPTGGRSSLRKGGWSESESTSLSFTRFTRESSRFRQSDRQGNRKRGLYLDKYKSFIYFASLRDWRTSCASMGVVLHPAQMLSETGRDLSFTRFARESSRFRQSDRQGNRKRGLYLDKYKSFIYFASLRDWRTSCASMGVVLHPAQMLSETSRDLSSHTVGRSVRR